MKIHQSLFNTEAAEAEWQDMRDNLNPEDARVVLAFGPRKALGVAQTFESIRKRFPSAHIVTVSTAGSFADSIIADTEVLCTAWSFEHAEFRTASANFKSGDDLPGLCAELAQKLAAPDLRHVLIFSDGSRVNGSTLSNVFNQCLPQGVTLSGGLAGDGTDFQTTLVGLDEPPAPGNIVALGLYGTALQIGFGVASGWCAFGPTRVVTAAQGNVLKTLDGRPALALYREYLGEEAAGLPASALRFPLFVQSPGDENSVVRTILSIDDAEQTMTFAGDIPEGATARFMYAAFDDLISGAEEAGAAAAKNQDASLVLCVSCVGRRIVLGQRAEEEVEGVRMAFGKRPVLAGFYSYGELAPSGYNAICQLHNQTMTVTSISEAI